MPNTFGLYFLAYLRYKKLQKFQAMMQFPFIALIEIFALGFKGAMNILENLLYKHENTLIFRDGNLKRHEKHLLAGLRYTSFTLWSVLNIQIKIFVWKIGHKGTAIEVLTLKKTYLCLFQNKQCMKIQYNSLNYSISNVLLQQPKASTKKSRFYGIIP